MRRIDIEKFSACGSTGQRQVAIAIGINDIMDYLDAVRKGRPSWGSLVQELTEEGFSEAEAIEMRKRSEKEVREWDRIVHG